MSSPYLVLDRLRSGEPPTPAEIEDVVRGATDGSWDDAQLGAFLMGVAVRGLGRAETAVLTRAMLESGTRWHLADEVVGLADKHSTGGVGDKASLVLAPLLAACGIPVAMLTGRGLGHTGGTADKLEAIPGLTLALDRDAALASLESTGMAIGVATEAIAPADRRLYALRDVTGTVASLPLVVASILSKKLALGAAGVVYDVKCGSGALFEAGAEAAALASRLVEVSAELAQPARALVTDMSQPLGRRVGHAAEIAEALDCLSGEGPEDLAALSLELATEAAVVVGSAVTREDLRAALDSGRGREIFLAWAERQGADGAWLRDPRFALPPHEVAVAATESGWLAAVETRSLGLLLAELGGGRRQRGDAIDHAVEIEIGARIGDRVEAGAPLARLRSRTAVPEASERLRRCFVISPEAVEAPPLVRHRIAPERI